MDLLEAVNNNIGLKEKLADIEKNPFPETPVLFAKIKLLWNCNLSCKFCERPPVKKIMPAEVVKQTLVDLLRYGLIKVHFSGGEIFLHPEISKILKESVDLGLQVNLTTNGTLLTKEMAKFLTKIKIHSVSISLDSSIPRLHDKIRGKKGAYKATIKGIEYLLKYRKKHPKIRINTVLFRENVENMEGIHSLLASMDKKIIWKIIPVDSSDKNFHIDRTQAEKIALKACEWNLLQELPTNLKKSSYKALSKGLHARGYYKTHPCYMPWLHTFIDPLGFVYPCCMIRGHISSLGNVFNQSVQDIMEGRQMKKIRMAMATGHPLEICHKCDDFIEENKKLYELG